MVFFWLFLTSCRVPLGKEVGSTIVRQRLQRKEDKRKYQWLCKFFHHTIQSSSYIQDSKKTNEFISDTPQTQSQYSLTHDCSGNYLFFILSGLLLCPNEQYWIYVFFCHPTPDHNNSTNHSRFLLSILMESLILRLSRQQFQFIFIHLTGHFNILDVAKVNIC